MSGQTGRIKLKEVLEAGDHDRRLLAKMPLPLANGGILGRVKCGRAAVGVVWMKFVSSATPDRLRTGDTPSEFMICTFDMICRQSSDFSGAVFGRGWSAGGAGGLAGGGVDGDDCCKEESERSKSRLGTHHQRSPYDPTEGNAIPNDAVDPARSPLLRALQQLEAGRRRAEHSRPAHT